MISLFANHNFLDSTWTLVISNVKSSVPSACLILIRTSLEYTCLYHRVIICSYLIKFTPSRCQYFCLGVFVAKPGDLPKLFLTRLIIFLHLLTVLLPTFLILQLRSTLLSRTVVMFGEGEGIRIGKSRIVLSGRPAAAKQGITAKIRKGIMLSNVGGRNHFKLCKV